MTYQDLYLQHLEMRLNEGGKQADVDKTVAEFNKPTPDGFKAWLDVVPWASCSTCGDPFKPSEVEPNVTPTMEILCKNHAPTPH